MAHQMVLIVDFGSQYTQLIARAVRAQQVYCEIVPYTQAYDRIREKSPAALILSGSPWSVTQADAPLPDKRIWEMSRPILGICYGMQLIAQVFGGTVVKADKKEYGHARLRIIQPGGIFAELESEQTVWMSHGDAVEQLPPGFQALAQTDNAAFAAMGHNSLPIYALQFHPEVVHTPHGRHIIRNFLLNIAGLRGDWTAGSFIEETVQSIRRQVGNRKVILGLSGGVDSSVAAALIYKAIGDKLHPVYVDTGLMRKNESDKIRTMFAALQGFRLEMVSAGEIFLARLRGVSDPEQKRKIIGRTFIEVFEQQAARHPDAEFLAQGTLYPDVIESVSFKGPSVTIKSHHNVGGLPERMHLKLLEPLRELFKDEVREVGHQLGLPPELINRHPFPGPGLAVRILGEVTPEKVQLLQEIDDIFIMELLGWQLYNSTWQAFAVLLPVQSVGVMGDERTYAYVCALRAVNSVDGMTADWTVFPPEFLKQVSNRIINEVRGVNRVVFDISSKPPATIEWE